MSEKIDELDIYKKIAKSSLNENLQIWENIGDFLKDDPEWLKKRIGRNRRLINKKRKFNKYK